MAHDILLFNDFDFRCHAKYFKNLRDKNALEQISHFLSLKKNNHKDLQFM